MLVLGEIGFRTNRVLPKDGTEGMTGLLTLFGDPTTALHAATKQYVDTGVATLTNKTLVTPVISGAAPATPVANTLYTDSVVKGWLETSGAGAWTIDDDLNVSSITDNGVGDLTINWATAFVSANYAVVTDTVSVGGAGVGIFSRETTTTAKTASEVRIVVTDNTFTLADPSVGVSVVAIGDQ